MIEDIAFLDGVDPADHAATEKNTGYVAFDKYKKLCFMIHAGALAGTLDVDIEESKDTSGTGLQNLAGKTTTQWAATDDGKVKMVYVDENELSVGYRYVRCELTPIGAGANFAAVCVVGLIPRYEPVDDHDATVVAQIIR